MTDPDRFHFAAPPADRRRDPLAAQPTDAGCGFALLYDLAALERALADEILPDGGIDVACGA
jgi:hypothetical protein